jgi:hypothetical protein
MQQGVNMQSWSLDKFVREYGAQTAATIGKRSRQAVEQAIETGRDIKIVKVDGFYEMHEFKLLAKTRVDRIHLARV